MPATMEYWKEPMLDVMENGESRALGQSKNTVLADQQGTSISKPSFRLDFAYNDFDKAPGTPHDGSFINEIEAKSKVTDGMKKAGY